MFRRRSRRQDNIGVSRRIRHESFMNDREQIFAGQSLENPVLIRIHRRRIRLIDVKAHDRRILERGQRISQLVDIDPSRRRRQKIGPADDGHIKSGRGAQVTQRSAARSVHGAHASRKASDQAGSHRPVAIPVQTAALADEWRPGLAVLMG